MNKLIITALIALCLGSCHKKFDYECTDKIYDKDLNLIYKSEPYHKRMTESEWNVYLAKMKTATTTTGCCKK
jgi:hypothetical protein